MSNRRTLREIHEGLKKYFEKNFLFLYHTNSERIEIIDEEGDSILFDYTSSSGRSTFRYLHVKDISTGKSSFLSIPYELNTCKQAVAWTFGMTPSEYILTKES